MVEDEMYNMIQVEVEQILYYKMTADMMNIMSYVYPWIIVFVNQIQSNNYKISINQTKNHNHTLYQITIINLSIQLSPQLFPFYFILILLLFFFNLSSIHSLQFYYLTIFNIYAHYITINLIIHMNQNHLQNQPSIIHKYPINKSIHHLDFNYNMKYISFCSHHPNINVIHLANPNKNIVFKGHTKQVLTLQYSPNSMLLASGSADQTIRLWAHTVDGKSKVIKGHAGPVRTINFSFDGQYLLSGSDDKSLKIWDLNSLKFKSSYVGQKNWIRTAKFNNDISKIVSGGQQKKVHIWDTETKKILNSYLDHENVINDCHFHKIQPWVFSCSADKTIKIHDLRNNKLVQHYDAHSDSVNKIDIHPTGNVMMSVSNDSQIKFWDLRKGLLMLKVYSHNGNVNTCKFSRGGNYFGTGGSDNNGIFWRTGIVKRSKEEIMGMDLCSSGHRTDLRTRTNIESRQKKQINSKQRKRSKVKRSEQLKAIMRVRSDSGKYDWRRVKD